MALALASRATVNVTASNSVQVLKRKYDQLVSLQQVEEQQLLQKESTCKALCAQTNALRELKLKQATETAAMVAGISRLDQNVAMRESHLQMLEESCDCAQASQSELHTEIQSGLHYDEKQKDVLKMTEGMLKQVHLRLAKVQMELSLVCKTHATKAYGSEDIAGEEIEKQTQELKSRIQSLSHPGGVSDDALASWTQECVGQCAEQFGVNLQQLVDEIVILGKDEQREKDLQPSNEEDLERIIDASQRWAAGDAGEKFGQVLMELDKDCKATLARLRRLHVQQVEAEETMWHSQQQLATLIACKPLVQAELAFVEHANNLLQGITTRSLETAEPIPDVAALMEALVIPDAMDPDNLLHKSSLDRLESLKETAVQKHASLRQVVEDTAEQWQQLCAARTIWCSVEAEGEQMKGHCQALRAALGQAERSLQELAAQTDVMRAARPTTYEALDPLQPILVPPEFAEAVDQVDDSEALVSSQAEEFARIMHEQQQELRAQLLQLDEQISSLANSRQEALEQLDQRLKVLGTLHAWDAEQFRATLELPQIVPASDDVPQYDTLAHPLKNLQSQACQGSWQPPPPPGHRGGESGNGPSKPACDVMKPVQCLV
eukprot:GGOE01000631.1.p1 GENE.GGOE01000631.1~~GGOE01000631.1.p1  ORF type:complete len:607 (+),score=158.18 GGOE01000631.1:693-2513(+)